MRKGLVAEFETPRALRGAARALVEEGYARLDAFVPFPDKKLEAILGLRRSWLNRFTLLAGLTGAGVAYLILWWTQVIDYPLNIGGRPKHAIPAWVPIVFETTVIFAGTTAFFSWLFLCGMPRLWHPLFEIDGFERATVDRYFLTVGADDPRYDFQRTMLRLGELGAYRVIPVGEEASE